MMATTSLLLSAIALFVSIGTAWLTLFRRGVLMMTQPTVIYFGPDAEGPIGAPPDPKIYLRTLIFSTGKRGRMIESMHARVTRNETVQNFNVWVYGEQRLVRGSGLFVGESGVTANHHFLAPKDGNAFSFQAGSYQVDFFVKVLGIRKHMQLWTHELVVTPEHASALLDSSMGLYFDWGPDSGQYMPHLKKKPSHSSPLDFLDLLNSQPNEASE